MRHVNENSEFKLLINESEEEKTTLHSSSSSSEREREREREIEKERERLAFLKTPPGWSESTSDGFQREGLLCVLPKWRLSGVRFPPKSNYPPPHASMSSRDRPHAGPIWGAPIQRQTANMPRRGWNPTPPPPEWERPSGPHQNAIRGPFIRVWVLREGPKKKCLWPPSASEGQRGSASIRFWTQKI